MALSKPIKKENNNKFEPVLNVDYDVRLLGFCEVGTQSQKDFNSSDEDATIEEEQIGVALQFIGYTEENEETGEVDYHPCTRKFGKEEGPLIETYIKKLATGSKSFIGSLIDSAAKSARDKDGNITVAKAIGKLLTMRKVVENIGGKELEIWKPSPMPFKLKAGVEIVHDEPTFLFDLTDGEGGAGDGFSPEFSDCFPESCGMRLVSAVTKAAEYVDYIEGEGSPLDDLIAELIEEHGTFDKKPDGKKKPASRKTAAKPKAKPKDKVAPKKEPEPAEETEEEAELREFKEQKAAKKLADEKEAKAKAKAKAAAALAAKEAESGDPAEETEEEKEAREFKEFQDSKKAEAEKVADKPKVDKTTEEPVEDGEEADPF